MTANNRSNRSSGRKLEVALFLLTTWFLHGVEAQKLQGSDKNSCRLATFIPFTDTRSGAPDDHANEGSYGYGSWPSAEVLGKASFSLMASAEMARRHFNKRDATIVTELNDLVGDCELKLAENSFFLDSGYSRDLVVDSFLTREFDNVRDGVDPKSSVCAIIGPVETQSHEGLSPFAENFKIPQVAYNSIAHKLSSTDVFPMFARVSVDATSWGETMAKAVHRDLWLREYLAIIYEPVYGDDFESPLEDAEDELDNFLTITESIEEGSDDSIRDALEEVIKEGYRTIFYIGDRFTVLDDVARIADEMGLLGEGYFWILSGAVVPRTLLPTVRNQVGSPLDKLLNGAAVFTNYDSFIYEPANNTFLSSWQENPAQLAEYLNFQQPLTNADAGFYYASPDYFQTEVPSEYASFIYDAVMCTGIAACQAKARPNETKSPLAHYEEIKQCSFTGASGPLKFDTDDDGNYENSRDKDGLKFGLHNLRPLEADESGMRGYDTVLYALWSPDHEFVNSEGDTENGAWEKVEGEEFLFYGSTTEEPMPVRTVANANFLPKSTQTVGFILVGISLFLSLCSAGWVFIYRNDKLIRASQPPFLYLLCFGSMMVALSLVFISFDEDKGTSDAQLDRLCSTFPWMFVLGYETIYCALLMKLWRLSQLMQFRRKVVKISQVLLNFSVVLVATVVVLTIMQILDPLVWVRDTTNFDPLETYGKCQTEGNIYAYIIPLGFLIVLVTIATGVYAWKLKNVQSDLAESKWIFFAIFVHLQTWALGIPIVVITDDVSREAGYMMIAALTFVFSTTMVGFVIWPKIFVWFRDNYLGGKKATTNIAITGSGQQRARVSGFGSSGPPQDATVSKGFSVGSGTSQDAEVSSLRKQVEALKMSSSSSKNAESEPRQEQPLSSSHIPPTEQQDVLENKDSSVLERKADDEDLHDEQV